MQQGCRPLGGGLERMSEVYGGPRMLPGDEGGQYLFIEVDICQNRIDC